MEKVQNPNTTEVAKRIDLDQFKSLYYLLNAKPDSQIKLLKEDKKICLEDLHELNRNIAVKLETENITTYITTITIVYKNKKVSNYSSWMEFERTNFQISDQTVSVSINWDINIKLPQHELPQRHTLKVRLGSPIRPNEMFQLMMTSDSDDEILEATSNGVCKVDFINTVIANELLAIVDEWYSGLPNILSSNKFVRYAGKHKRPLAFSLNSLIPISAIFIGYNILIWRITKIGDWTNSVLSQFLFYVACVVSLIFVSAIFARLVSNKIFGQLKEFDKYSMFELTKGDKNSLEEVDKKNNKIRTSIVTQFAIALIVALLSLFLAELLKT